MLYTLTPKRLIAYLDRYYGYKIDGNTAIAIIARCEEEYGYDEIYSSEELIEIVDLFMEEA